MKKLAFTAGLLPVAALSLAFAPVGIRAPRAPLVNSGNLTGLHVEFSDVENDADRTDSVLSLTNRDLGSSIEVTRMILLSKGGRDDVMSVREFSPPLTIAPLGTERFVIFDAFPGIAIETPTSPQGARVVAVNWEGEAGALEAYSVIRRGELNSNPWGRTATMHPSFSLSD